MAKEKSTTEKWIRVKTYYAGKEGIFIQDEIRFVSESTLKQLEGKLKYDLVDANGFKLKAKPVKDVSKNAKKKDAAKTRVSKTAKAAEVKDQAAKD